MRRQLIPRRTPGGQTVCVCTLVEVLQIRALLWVATDLSRAPQLLRQFCPAQKLWVVPSLLHGRLIAEGLVEVGQTVRAIGIVVTAKANREPLSSKRLLLRNPDPNANLLRIHWNRLAQGTVLQVQRLPHP